VTSNGVVSVTFLFQHQNYLPTKKVAAMMMMKINKKIKLGNFYGDTINNITTNAQ